MSSNTIPVLFEMFRGDDVGFLVKVKEPDGTKTNITGWRFLTTMKRGPTADENDENAPVQIDSGVLFGPEAEEGEYYLLLPNDQTRNLGQGLYYMDVSQTEDGRDTTVIFGRVRVQADITRRSAA